MWSAEVCLVLSSFQRTHRSFLCLRPVCYTLSHSFFILENPQKLHLLMPCLLHSVPFILISENPQKLPLLTPCLLHSVSFILISENPQKLLLLMPCLLPSVSFFLHFREPTGASSAYAMSVTDGVSHFRSFSRTHKGLICFGPVCYNRLCSFFLAESLWKRTSTLGPSTTRS